MLLLLVALLDIAVLLLDTHSSTILDTHRSTILIEYYRSTTAGVYSSIIAIHVLLLKHKIITVAPFEWKSSPSNHAVSQDILVGTLFSFSSPCLVTLLNKVVVLPNKLARLCTMDGLFKRIVQIRDRSQLEGFWPHLPFLLLLISTS
jgi:hypothetical protein